MKKYWVYIIGFAIFVAIVIIRMEYAFIYGFFTLIAVSFFLEKKKFWAWIPALAVSWLWIYIATAVWNAYYGYDDLKFYIFGIAVFPIVTWPLGLMAGYLIVVPFIKIENRFKKWMMIFLIYAVGLILLESVGHNIIGLHLHYGKQFRGWPVLNCFHSPPWMQIGYFLNGFVFYGLTSFLENTKLTGPYVVEAVKEQTPDISA